MPPELLSIFTAQGLVASSPQILAHLKRRTMARHLRDGDLVRVWPGIYSLGEPDVPRRLNGLDLQCGERVVVCLHTAAAGYGFDTEGSTALHVLHPLDRRLRDCDGLVVHRRDGAPLSTIDGRPATAPGWTAVEVARALRRPRALAVLDAALRAGACTPRDLVVNAKAQAGRRGIVVVRELIPLARPGAESPMESETRLVMIDGRLPEPELQYEIVDRDGRLWRVDFAWPDRRVAVEFDGFAFHSSPEALRHDRQKRAALEELGWHVISVVADDVRRNPVPMLRRISGLLEHRAA